MYDYIDKLSFSLRLTPYQSGILKDNFQNYNMGRIVKRGGVIYVPYVSHGLIAQLVNLIHGVRADLIGQNKILIKNKRKITFCKNGYFLIKSGRYKYYADASGQAISREDFLRSTKS